MTDSVRLSNATLARLPLAVARPGYDRTTLATGLVHLGTGAFHRAHQALYTETVLASGDHRWGILGASLRSRDLRDALVPQDGLYTVAVREGDRDHLQVVGSIGRLLVAPEDPERLLAAMAAPDVAIVSLTVTEKGYCHDPATGDLDESNPDVRHDLAHPASPRGALGFIVEAARRRRAAGVPPFALLSCDNLPANGVTLHRVATRFATLRDPELGRYIADALRCPSTMVDRIVPATTAADKAVVSGSLGLRDAWPVMTEPFSQWVIEDAFGGPRPAWDSAGARFVTDVTPYELMKLRLLNGSHSTLAYLGCLAGHDTVAATMMAPGFATLVRAMMDEEVTPELPALAGFDLGAYKTSLIDRFRNTALNHRLSQIAMDGSQKLPQRLLSAIRARLARGAPVDRLALAVAAWMRYATGRDEQGNAIDLRDPMAETLRRCTAGLTQARPLLEASLALPAIFGTDLPHHPGFRAPVELALSRLLADGAAATVVHYAAL